MINNYTGLKKNEALMAGTKAPNTNESEPSLGTAPLWTVEDVACYLRLNPETIRVMARRGELPSIKLGKRVWRFKTNEIKDWLELQHEVLGGAASFQ
jgi:excisionase family DNA binding protein